MPNHLEIIVCDTCAMLTNINWFRLYVLYSFCSTPWESLLVIWQIRELPFCRQTPLDAHYYGEFESLNYLAKMLTRNGTGETGRYHTNPMWVGQKLKKSQAKGQKVVKTFAKLALCAKPVKSQKGKSGKRWCKNVMRKICKRKSKEVSLRKVGSE